MWSVKPVLFWPRIVPQLRMLIQSSCLCATGRRAAVEGSVSSTHRGAHLGLDGFVDMYPHAALRRVVHRLGRVFASYQLAVDQPFGLYGIVRFEIDAMVVTGGG